MHSKHDSVEYNPIIRTIKYTYYRFHININIVCPCLYLRMKWPVTRSVTFINDFNLSIKSHYHIDLKNFVTFKFDPLSKMNVSSRVISNLIDNVLLHTSQRDQQFNLKRGPWLFSRVRFFSWTVRDRKIVLRAAREKIFIFVRFATN